MRNTGRGRNRSRTFIADLPIYKAITAVIRECQPGQYSAKPGYRYQLIRGNARLCPAAVMNAALHTYPPTRKEIKARKRVGFDESSPAANATAAEMLEILCFPVWDTGEQLEARNARPRTFREGKIRAIVLTRHERNSDARSACIAHYGLNCAVCSVNFRALYGEIGDGYIQVHHVRDIATMPDEYEVDPVADLRPVCANCHAMLHVEKPAMSIENLREIVQFNQQFAQ